jgi:malate permease and related proteins
VLSRVPCLWYIEGEFYKETEMDNSILLNQILIVFLMLLVGVYAKKTKIIDSALNKGLTALLLNITLPLNIISSFSFDYSKELLVNIIKIFIFGMLIHPISFGIGKLIFMKFNKTEKNILIFSAIFSNCGFMAFPILESIFGKIGVLYGAIFTATFNIYLWTLGVKLFSKGNFKWELKNIMNAGVISIIVGMGMFILSVKLPYPIQRCFEVVGSMTTPLSMIICGVNIGSMSIKSLFTTKSIYALSIVRLIVIPVISSVILKAAGISGVVYSIGILVTAMPVAAMCSVFAERFDGDAQFASQNVFITTILSVITIPVIAFLLI